MKKIISVLISLIIISCTDNSQFKSAVSYINNTTDKDIKIIKWENGKISDSLVTLSIYSNSIKEVNYSKGNISGYAFSLSRTDSVVIQFDDSIYAVHYINAIGNNNKGLTPENIRNIFNPVSWEEVTLVNSKKKINKQYTYTFTEQDYLDAKNK